MLRKIEGLSVIIPVRDEGGTIKAVVQDCLAQLDALASRYEVIVVDDHSSEDVDFLLDGLPCRVVKNVSRTGKGNAIRSGLKECRYGTVVMLDGDYSHRPEDLPVLVKEFEKGFGLVVASRAFGGSDEYSLMRSMGNMLATSMFNLLFGVHLSDALNGFKIFDRLIADTFAYVSEGFGIEIELLANARSLGLSIGQVPSHERRRSQGIAKSMPFVMAFSVPYRILCERMRYGKKKRIDGPQAPSSR